jgi:hypothetical protein
MGSSRIKRFKTGMRPTPTAKAIRRMKTVAPIPNARLPPNRRAKIRSDKKVPRSVTEMPALDWVKIIASIIRIKTMM